MNKLLVILISVSLLAGLNSCQKWLDINQNPNNPEYVEPYLYLPPIQAEMALGVQFDARFSGRYVQNWAYRATSDIWDTHGYNSGSDNGGQLWRFVYFSAAQNLTDMIKKAEAAQRWDLVGIGKAIRAWGWQMLTDYHGEVIIQQAFIDRKTFDYDTQEYAYQEVKKLCNEAITALDRTDGNIQQSYTARGDKVYGGDRAKWKKFVYGLLAINAHHLSNKTGTYNPNEVINYVNQSFSGNADDFLVPFNGAVTDDSNFFGPRRSNFQSTTISLRQTKFIVDLLSGTIFTGVDPRRSRMLVTSSDGNYYGLTPGTTLSAAQDPKTPWNTTGVAPAGTVGFYLFADKAFFPLMTYAQLQFIKSEAAFKAGDRPMALAALKEGIKAHFAFVNKANNDIGNTATTAITDTERDNYIATAITNIPANLRLKDIMLQKYIAQWGWGFNEQWADLRRYHYTDIDLETTAQVFVGFTLPTTFFADNGGKPAYRVRPRYNSEYVWNRAALDKIGGLAQDYHTVEMWFTKP